MNLNPGKWTLALADARGGVHRSLTDGSRCATTAFVHTGLDAEQTFAGTLGLATKLFSYETFVSELSEVGFLLLCVHDVVW